MSMDTVNWHRLFGIALTDLLSDTGWRVELERNVALESQFLDVVIIERTDGDTTPPVPFDLPDGLDDLRAHNLLTFKSRHQALDGWAIDELVGHYVNYRKQMRRGERRLPETDFGLFAVSTRMPQELVQQGCVRPTSQAGVFDIPWRTRHIRLVVLGEVEQHPRNAAWALFATQMARIRHGVTHYRFRRPEAETLFYRLYLARLSEDVGMAYTMEQFVQETAEILAQDDKTGMREVFLKNVPPDVRLRGLTPGDRLHGLTPEDRLHGLTPEDRLHGLTAEDRLLGLTPEDRLHGLTPEDRLRGLSEDERRQLKALLDKSN